MGSLGSSTTVAGRYVTGQLLGTGGMGEVYDAVDTRLDRPVALKRLRADLADDVAMRRRVETEARLAARLTHPNVVTVFDSGLEAGHPFIVMERLDGRTLRDELAEGPMEPGDVRSMALQVLEALAAAHGIGLIHRDVKPGNILVAGEGTWKVADFGIATSIEDDHTLTKTGELLGSASYLAPERLEGHAATTRSDIYSLGVVMYEALTGRPPFGEGTPIALAIRIRDGRYEPLRRVAPEVEPALAKTVARAMSKDPMGRFASAEEMALALTEHDVPGASADTTAIVERPSESTAVLEAMPAAVEPQPVAAESAADPAVTEPVATPPTEAPRRPARRLATALLVGVIGVVAVIAVVLVLTLGTDTSGSPSAPTDAVTSGSPVPAPLQDALDQLQESITP
jgi:serine/threonine-protein kinase